MKNGYLLLSTTSTSTPGGGPTLSITIKINGGSIINTTKLSSTGWGREISCPRLEISPKFRESSDSAPPTHCLEGSSVFVVFKTTSNSGAKIMDKLLRLNTALSFWITCKEYIKGQAQLFYFPGSFLITYFQTYPKTSGTPSTSGWLRNPL